MSDHHSAFGIRDLYQRIERLETQGMRLGEESIRDAARLADITAKLGRVVELLNRTIAACPMSPSWRVQLERELKELANTS